MFSVPNSTSMAMNDCTQVNSYSLLYNGGSDEQQSPSNEGAVAVHMPRFLQQPECKIKKRLAKDIEGGRLKATKKADHNYTTNNGVVSTNADWNPVEFVKTQKEEENPGAETPSALEHLQEEQLTNQEMKQKLFEHTLFYFKIGADSSDYMERTMAQMFADCHTQDDFERVIFTNTWSNALVWTSVKNMLVGNYHNIELCSTTENLTRSRQVPVQFGGLKSCYMGGAISHKNIDLGDFGERWVLLNEIGLNNNCWMGTSGKICWHGFPIATTTPDYILYGPKKPKEGMPIHFFSEVIGIGECKTSNISDEQVEQAAWDRAGVTVKELFEECKPKWVLRSHNADRVGPCPPWLKREGCPDLHKEIFDAVKASTKWTLTYFESIGQEDDEQPLVYDLDMTLEGNQMYPKLLGSKVGKQMLCEMISVVDYVQGNSVKAVEYLPSATSSHKMTYCLHCSFDLPKKLVLRMKELVEKTMTRVLYETATEAFIPL